MLSLLYIFVKHGKVIVVLSNISMINMIHISFMVLSFYGLSGLRTVLNTQKLNGLYSDRQKPAVCHVCL
jgi:hypothetical protein